MTQARLIAVIVALLVWGSSIVGVGWWAYGAGQGSEISKSADAEKIRRETQDASEAGAAKAIAKLQPTQQTIIQRATHEIRTETKFTDCRSGVGLMRSANAIAAGASAPADGGELPGPDATR